MTNRAANPFVLRRRRLRNHSGRITSAWLLYYRTSLSSNTNGRVRFRLIKKSMRHSSNKRFLCLKGSSASSSNCEIGMQNFCSSFRAARRVARNCFASLIYVKKNREIICKNNRKMMTEIHIGRLRIADQKCSPPCRSTKTKEKYLPA